MLLVERYSQKRTYAILKKNAVMDRVLSASDYFSNLMRTFTALGSFLKSKMS